MARARDQFRRSDVRFWGLAALVCGGAAVASTTMSAALPGSILSRLHTSVTGINMSQVVAPVAPHPTDTAAASTPQGLAARARLTELESDEARLRTANADLEARLAAATTDTQSLVERVGALEASLPRLADAISARPAMTVDPSLVTGSIGAPASRFSMGSLAESSPAAAGPLVMQSMPAFPAEPSNWAAAYMLSPAAAELTSLLPEQTRSPVPLAPVRRPDPIAEAAIDPSPAASQAPAASGPAAPVAAAAKADIRSIGIAIGAPVPPATALVAWQGLAAKVGILLVGTSPLLADDPAGSNGKVLVAGPLPDIAAAEKLCGSIDRSGITCTPMPYVGNPLPPAAD